MANWAGSNTTSAFFASLERCSCINLAAATHNDHAHAHDLPLILILDQRPTQTQKTQNSPLVHPTSILRLTTVIFCGVLSLNKTETDRRLWCQMPMTSVLLAPPECPDKRWRGSFNICRFV